MGPPARPADRQQAERSGERQGKDNSVDMNSLTDVMFGTGVDLKAEEAAMMASYRDSQQNTSFNSSQTMSMTPGNSFDARSLSFPSAGVLSQSVSQQQVEEDIAAQQKQASRMYNERQQATLYNPFLQIDVLRKKLSDKAYQNGVRLNLEGLFVKTRPEPQTTVLNGANGGHGVVKVQGGSWIQAEAPLVDTLSLLTLAANERLRGLCDDAYGLARGRQASADGIIDPDWADLAVGPGKVNEASAVPLSVSRTAWDQPDSAVSPSTAVPLKRPLEDTNGNSNRLPTPPSESSPPPRPTKSFSNTTTAQLRSLAKQDLEAERARLASRLKRQRAASAAANGGTAADGTSTNSGTATPGTPGAQTAPDLPLQNLSKKQQDKQRKKAADDPNAQHVAARTVLNKALGGGRKYSWMSGGKSDAAKAPPTPAAKLNTNVGGATTPGGTGSATTPGRQATGPARPVEPGLQSKDRTFGEWREDGAGGAGVQIRDLLHVLEHDGKAKKTYVRTLTNMRNGEKVEEAEVAGEKRQ